MKASFLSQTGDPSVLQFGEQPDPQPAANEVIVRLYTAALNHVDIWVRTGSPAYPVKLPHVPGSDGAGVVEAVGPDVEGVTEGDRVVVFPGLSCGACAFCRAGHDNQCEQFEILGTKKWGTYAEKVAVPDENVIVLPDHISFEQAAAFPVAYGTAWHMLIGRAAVKKGESVVVLGASSGIGVAAIQIAKVKGARVLAVTTDAEKSSAIKENGADVVFVISEGAAGFSSWVLEQTNGKGADVVVEHVGPATWEESIKSLSKCGRLVTCGATTGPTVNLDLRFLFSREQSLLGARLTTKREFQELSHAIFSGHIKPVVDRIFPLEKAAEAHAYLETKKQIGKIILKI